MAKSGRNQKKGVRVSRKAEYSGHVDDIDTSLYMGYESFKDAVDAYEYTSQAEALARMLSRQNVFITGPSGSGKSYVIKKFLEVMKGQFGEKVTIAVTGSTGISASLIGGRTIHSWSGIGIQTDVSKIFAHNPDIKKTDVLIIDEISMLPAYYLDMVNTVCKKTRRNNKPFGGIQVIFLGDFHQLPPVPNRSVPDELFQGFAIYSDAWDDADIYTCFLDKSIRAQDEKLAKVLWDMENDSITQETVDILRHRRLGAVQMSPDKTYTNLYTLNKRVDKINAEKLEAQPGKVYSYATRAVPMMGKNPEFEMETKKVKLPDDVLLKENAVVMVTSNHTVNVLHRSPARKNAPEKWKYTVKDSRMIANGSIGTVEHIIRAGESRELLAKTVVMRLNDGELVAVQPIGQNVETYKTMGKKQVPVKGETDERGKQKYVTKDIVNKVIVGNIFYLPLKLAYAITVHKSQGQTLDGVYADLSKCFSPGMGYVALSRVRRIDDLVIEDFNRDTLRMNPDSLRISKRLKRSAKKERKEILDKMDEYDAVLQVDVIRSIYWADKTA